jgi:hypothetical protein
MSAVMKMVAVAGVLGTVACGATTSGSSGGNHCPHLYSAFDRKADDHGEYHTNRS